MKSSRRYYYSLIIDFFNFHDSYTTVGVGTTGTLDSGFFSVYHRKTFVAGLDSP